MKQPAPLPYESPCFCTNLRRAAGAVSDYYDEGFRPLCLTASQYYLLVNIGRVEPVSTADLARHVGLERSTLVRNLRVLERNGWVCDTSNTLKHHFMLTDEGRALLTRAVPVWEGLQEQFEHAVGPKDSAALMRLLKNVQRLRDTQAQK